jgi:ABC-2 type transport system ATP-binding protein
VLELDGLSRRYGDVVALQELSFSVEAGQLFGFVGANGAGKTTAMRIVVGLERADAGEVRWQGDSVARLARRRFGYLPEERGLYPNMQARWQLTYLARLRGVGRAAARRAADDWLQRLGLAERGDEPVQQLSLGNQQRVQLAAAMVHDPDVLLLDEPFAGLDPMGVDALSEVLVAVAGEGVAVVFSSHQLELVEHLCDAVAIIDDGRLVAGGRVDELRRAGRRRQWRVDVAGADSAWATALAGVHVRHTFAPDPDHAAAHARRAGEGDGHGPDGDGTAVILEIEDGVDAQAVLDAARAAGAVTCFREIVPSLAERYREVVTGGSP